MKHSGTSFAGRLPPPGHHFHVMRRNRLGAGVLKIRQMETHGIPEESSPLGFLRRRGMESLKFRPVHRLKMTGGTVEIPTSPPPSRYYGKHSTFRATGLVPL